MNVQDFSLRFKIEDLELMSKILKDEYSKMPEDRSETGKVFICMCDQLIEELKKNN